MFTQGAAELKLDSGVLLLPVLSFLIWKMGAVEGVTSPGSTQQRKFVLRQKH